MQTQLPRRRFLALTVASGILLPAAALRGENPSPSSSATPASSSPPQIFPRNAEPIADESTHEFVWRGHFDLDGVRRMLAEQPGLLNASYDWGRGDFETAIGGAGHMGRRDIAELLLAQGSRADIFVSAMLGHLDIVKAFLAATPSLLHAKGPHGIPLLRHALAGGAAAAPVVDYLRAQGAR